MLIGADPTLYIILIGAFLLFYFCVLIPRFVSRSYRSYKALQEPTQIDIKEEGLLFTRETAQGLTPWSHITKWRANKNLILIYPTINIYYLIPGHFFTSYEAFEDFKSLLRARVGKQK